MPCYYPITAFQGEDGVVTFAERRAHGSMRTLSLPCGRCVGCRLERSRQWAVRCVHEAALHEQNCFVTLTYSEEKLPSDLSLRYRDFQLFMKRFRRKFGSVRFFVCGEYGEETSRPHYHACLFGFDFRDKVALRVRDGRPYLFTSASLDGLWSHGYGSVGEVNFESAAYVARYVMKKELGVEAGPRRSILDVTTGELVERDHEFCHMSLRPGIGARWFSRFASDVFPHDYVVVNGQMAKPPRFYDKKAFELDPDMFELVQDKRGRDSRLRYEDNTVERLAVKERVTKARIRSLKRGL